MAFLVPSSTTDTYIKCAWSTISEQSNTNTSAVFNEDDDDDDFVYSKQQQRAIRPLTGCNIQQCILVAMLELSKISCAIVRQITTIKYNMTVKSVQKKGNESLLCHDNMYNGFETTSRPIVVKLSTYSPGNTADG